MDKLRSISTSFWSDSYIEELSPEHKLVFLYLLTSSKTNMLGIYENSIKKMAFETGLTHDQVQEAIKEFSDKQRIQYIQNYVIVVNFLKHQKLNPNMIKSAIKTFNDLPDKIKDAIKSDPISKPLNDFLRLQKAYITLPKIESENEDELETKDEYKIEKEFEKEKKPIVTIVKDKNIYREFDHVQLPQLEFEILTERFRKNDIDVILDRIENYKDNAKYKSMYVTAEQWLDKDNKEIKIGRQTISSIKANMEGWG